MRKEIEQTFNEKILALDPNDPTFEARKYLINIERAKKHWRAQIYDQT